MYPRRKTRKGPDAASNKFLPFQQRSAASRRRWFEQLEQRRLLSISPPDYASLPLSTFDTALASPTTVANSDLMGGLRMLADWAKQIDAYGAVGAATPIANESVGQAVNLQDIIGSQFVAAIDAYLTNNPGATA
ncbi:MAG: hypothetical protein B7Z73_16425, partial [Planctomycetia bacterium 21-64-5]